MRDTAGIEVLRPGRDGLDPTCEQRLQAALADAVPDLRIAEMFRLRPGLLRSYDHLLVARTSDGALVGLLGCTWQTCAELSLLHVGIQMVAPHHRRTGLFGQLWRHEVAEVLPGEAHRPSLVGVKTSNPVVYLAMRAFARIACGSLYPDVEGGSAELALVELAGRVGSVVAPGHPFDAATGVVRGVGLPPDLYEDAPTTGHAVARYFAQHLRPEDRLLCLLRCPGFDDPGEGAALLRSVAAALGGAVVAPR